MIDPTYPRPRKERRRVKIPTAATAVGEPERPTWHDYVGAEKRHDPRFGSLRPEWHLIYRCEETGVERSFGVEGKPTPERVAPEPA